MVIRFVRIIRVTTEGNILTEFDELHVYMPRFYNMLIEVCQELHGSTCGLY